MKLQNTQPPTERPQPQDPIPQPPPIESPQPTDPERGPITPEVPRPEDLPEDPQINDFQGVWKTQNRPARTALGW